MYGNGRRVNETDVDGFAVGLLCRGYLFVLWNAILKEDPMEWMGVKKRSLSSR